MEQFLMIHRLNHTDLDMYQCGTEACQPGHYYGPAVRDHFLIHYIHSGKGCFSVDGTVYNLQKGQGFLICPDVITYYQADVENPWHYSWVGFHGTKAEAYLKTAGLTRENPIFCSDGSDFIENCFINMIEAKALQKGREIRLLGHLFLFLSQLIEQNGKNNVPDQSGSGKEVYVKKAIEYIEMNYSRKMTIAGLARHVGLDRSYMGSIFRELLAASPQEFLLNYRIDKACGLMKNEDLSIGDISRSVGYDDPLQFSKMFKKSRGLSPREYRTQYSIGIN